MSASLTVRPVAEADFADWLRLWEGYNRFYRREGPTAVPDEVTRMTWSRFFDAYEPMHALVAESHSESIGSKLLGLVHYLYHRNTVMLGPTCYLQDLFTDENARGKGVGRALIEGVYERAKAAGSPRVYWMTHETNETAMQLYDKVAEHSGFVVYRKEL